jgi:hypothetical protein
LKKKNSVWWWFYKKETNKKFQFASLRFKSLSLMIIHLCLDFFWIVLVFRIKVGLISLRRAVVEKARRVVGIRRSCWKGWKREGPMRRRWVGEDGRWVVESSG